MKTIFPFLALGSLALGLFAQPPASAPKPPAAPPAKEAKPAKPAAAQDMTEVKWIQFQPNFYMLVGAGGNVTMQVGTDGILLVDTGLVNRADALLAAVRKISDKPIRYIINTHYHPDHTGGNEKLRAAGGTITGGNVAGDIGDAAVGAAIIATENTLNRMSAPTGKEAATPTGAWPTNTFFDDEKKLWFNNEGIEILHAPEAHTDGDIIVYFRKADVIVTGDIFTTTSYPFIDIAGGGTIGGELKALTRIVEMVIPVYGQDGGSVIIPGHGRVCDVGDVINFREMVTVVRDVIANMKKNGKTLAQIKEARPTAGYDPRYAPPGAFVTPDAFVEAIYNTLGKGGDHDAK